VKLKPVRKEAISRGIVSSSFSELVEDEVSREEDGPNDPQPEREQVSWRYVTGQEVPNSVSHFFLKRSRRRSSASNPPTIRITQSAW